MRRFQWCVMTMMTLGLGCSMSLMSHRAQAQPLRVSTLEQSCSGNSCQYIRGQGVCAPIFQHGRDVYCLTVAHVLTGAQQISVDGHAAQVVHADIQQEIALLKFQSDQRVPVVPTKLRQTASPRSGCLWTFDGNQTVRKCGPVQGDVIGLNVVPGQSGSPILNEQGELIGLVHMSNGKFIPWSRYEAMLDRLGCLPKSSINHADNGDVHSVPASASGLLEERLVKVERFQAELLVTIRSMPATVDVSRVDELEKTLLALTRELEELRPLKQRHLQLFDNAGAMTADVVLSPGDPIKIQSKVRVNRE